MSSTAQPATVQKAANLIWLEEIEAIGEKLRELVLKLRENEGKANDEFGTPDFEPHRWISTGEMHLKQGLMALTRAVAKPTPF